MVKLVGSTLSQVGLAPVMNQAKELPKCVSSAKRASMSKSERLSAARRKRADPGQQSKSGAAKPTYVSTDKPKKKWMKQ